MVVVVFNVPRSLRFMAKHFQVLSIVQRTVKHLVKYKKWRPRRFLLNIYVFT